MNDQKTVRLVIGILGLVALTIIVGGIALTFQDKDMPEALIALAGMSVGGVAGILSRTSDPALPQAVQVVNAPADPVPVNDAGMSDLGGLVLFVVAFILGVLCTHTHIFGL